MLEIVLYCRPASEIYASAIFLPISISRRIRSVSFLRFRMRRPTISLSCMFKISVSPDVERLIVVMFVQNKCRERLKFNNLQLFGYYICQSLD